MRPQRRRARPAVGAIRATGATDGIPAPSRTGQAIRQLSTAAYAKRSHDGRAFTTPPTAGDPQLTSSLPHARVTPGAGLRGSKLADAGSAHLSCRAGDPAAAAVGAVDVRPHAGPRAEDRVGRALREAGRCAGRAGAGAELAGGARPPAGPAVVGFRRPVAEDTPRDGARQLRGAAEVSAGAVLAPLQRGATHPAAAATHALYPLIHSFCLCHDDENSNK